MHSDGTAPTSMIESPSGPRHERERLRALHASALLDTPPDEAFDRIAKLAALVFDAPIALVSLVDADRQWFKARVGLDLQETARSASFCACVIDDPDVFVVEDAWLDPRFADNPLVVGDPRIRFYAGAQLRPEGHSLGTLCVIDHAPRTFSPRQRAQLAALAESAVAQIRLHRQAGRVNEASRLPNRARMAEDIAARAAVDPGGQCAILLIELISHRRMHEPCSRSASSPWRTRCARSRRSCAAGSGRTRRCTTSARRACAWP